MSTTATPAPTTAPVTPHQVHQSWLQILLEILKVSAAVAPAAAAPFVSASTEQIIAAESSVAEAVIPSPAA